MSCVVFLLSGYSKFRQYVDKPPYLRKTTAHWLNLCPAIVPFFICCFAPSLTRLSPAAGGRRVRHGAQLRGAGRRQHPAHAGGAGPLLREAAGEAAGGLSADSRWASSFTSGGGVKLVSFR